MTLYCEICARVFLERAASGADAACPACGLRLRRATSAELRLLVANWLEQNPRRVTRSAKTTRRSA